MDLLLDADGLIKLQRVGILEAVAREFNCAIPQMVYYEAVTQGKERSYPGAKSIDNIAGAAIRVIETHDANRSEGALGAGEEQVLALACQLEGESTIISDDRRFLAVLTKLGIPFLTPTGLIVLMAQRGSLALDRAEEALERLRPSIRDAHYREAMGRLKAGVKKQP